jgi:hypothetical protein
VLPHELFIGRSSRSCRGGRETGHGSREAKGREGECPKEDEAQESQGHRTRRNPATVRPNRQRDETPEARPLRQQCLQRRKRLAPRIREGRAFGGSFEELVL